MSSKRTTVISLGFVLLFAETAPAAEARPVTFEDIMSLRAVYEWISRYTIGTATN